MSFNINHIKKRVCPSMSLGTSLKGKNLLPPVANSYLKEKFSFQKGSLSVELLLVSVVFP